LLDAIKAAPRRHDEGAAAAAIAAAAARAQSAAAARVSAGQAHRPPLPEPDLLQLDAADPRADAQRADAQAQAQTQAQTQARADAAAAAAAAAAAKLDAEAAARAAAAKAAAAEARVEVPHSKLGLVGPAVANFVRQVGTTLERAELGRRPQMLSADVISYPPWVQLQCS
jgi:hypothetical protein